MVANTEQLGPGVSKFRMVKYSPAAPKVLHSGAKRHWNVRVRWHHGEPRSGSHATWFTAGMSLIVSIFFRDSSGMNVGDEAPGDSLAAGFENWRTQVWGSPRVRALGAEYFPRLAEADLYVDAGEVAAFLRECALLREHLDAIAATVDLSRQPGIAINTATGRVTAVSDSPQVFREQVSLRLANIESAARRALEFGAGVVIW